MSAQRPGLRNSVGVALSPYLDMLFGLVLGEAVPRVYLVRFLKSYGPAAFVDSFVRIRTLHVTQAWLEPQPGLINAAR
jgi:hypothetical protein